MDEFFDSEIFHSKESLSSSSEQDGYMRIPQQYDQYPQQFNQPQQYNQYPQQFNQQQLTNQYPQQFNQQQLTNQFPQQFNQQQLINQPIYTNQQQSTFG